MERPSRYLLALVAAASCTRGAVAQSRNPFLDLVDALTGQGSPFNGPDRGGVDTLHGEIDDHWFPGYAGLTLTGQPPNETSRTNWDAVMVPQWQDNNAPKVPVQPVAPQLPDYKGLIDGLHIVDGAFLVGAIKWPHEEYVEQYDDGTLAALTDEHKVPVYWVVGYRLFIPENYGSGVTAADAIRRGKALIIQAGGEGNDNVNLIKPPWMVTMFSEPEWREAAAQKAAVRLGVPVLYLGPDPVPINAFATNNRAHPQGGVTGYWGEALADFADHWSIKAPEADPLRDHPQFMYVATYIRARTFLECFFNPVSNDTTSWSPWDEITGNDATRYTSMRNVIAMAGSKRGHAVRIAGIADPCITAVVSNGAGSPNLIEHARLQMDEQWEDDEAGYLVGNKFADEMKAPPIGDPNQFRPSSGAQREVDVLNQLHAGLAQRQLQYYDYYRIFKNRDVVRDSDHPNNPLPETWILTTQGMQDNYWPLQNWIYWMGEDVFQGPHQYFDFHPTALHPPYFQEEADSIHAFCEAKWFGRPIPSIRLTGIDYLMPIQGESVATVPLTIHAQAIVGQNDQWPLEGQPTFDLCIAMRPVSATMGRGMWSDAPRGGPQNPQYGRQTPWWVIPSASVQQAGNVYNITFDANSRDYASVTPASPYFPEGFKDAFPNGLDLDGIPERYNVAFFVRVHATHGESGPDRWPISASSIPEFLPPWENYSGVGPRGRPGRPRGFELPDTPSGNDEEQ